MKTPIISTWFNRPNYFRRHETALFVPKGAKLGENSDGTAYLQKWDAVTVAHGTYPLRGQGSDLVRVIPDNYVTELDALDERIKVLEATRHELIGDAYRHGRPIKKSECETLEERRVRRAEAETAQ